MTQPTHSPGPLWLIPGALTGWFALIIQFYLMFQNRQTDLPEMIIRFFSYFTILTNLLVAIYFTVLLFKKPGSTFAFLRTPRVSAAICAYILFVGISYQVLLRHIWQPEGMQWIVDELLHTFIPLYVFIFWWFQAPKSNLVIRDLPAWLIYPVVYFGYVLLRGSMSGFYPYYFIDVSITGYRQAFINSVVMLLAFMGLSLLLIRLAAVIRKRSDRNSVHS